MIIERHEDGSEGYRYHQRDLVVITVESDKNFGREGIVVLDNTAERLRGYGSTISRIFVYEPVKDRFMGAFFAWELSPAISTYKECKEVINMIKGIPVEDFFKEIL